MGDQALELTSDRIAALRTLSAEAKFGPDMRVIYPGAPTESVRTECQAHINRLLDRLLAALPTKPTKGVALQEFRLALSHFEAYDSEERDRACGYLEQIMDILGIDSSDGLLNNWRYGFDPSQRDA